MVPSKSSVNDQANDTALETTSRADGAVKVFVFVTAKPESHEGAVAAITIGVVLKIVIVLIVAYFLWARKCRMEKNAAAKIAKASRGKLMLAIKEDASILSIKSFVESSSLRKTKVAASTPNLAPKAAAVSLNMRVSLSESRLDGRSQLQSLEQPPASVSQRKLIPSSKSTGKNQIAGGPKELKKPSPKASLTSENSPVFVTHQNWIYENLPASVATAPAVPDILEASLGRTIKTSVSTPTLKLVEEAHQNSTQQGCLPHCACRTTMSQGSRSPPMDDDSKKDPNSGFVDRARMVSFKRKKVAPTASTHSEGASCAQCTCFLDPVHLSHDPHDQSTTSSPANQRHDYENVTKTVILHTGFALPTDGTDLMLAMDSPRTRKIDSKSHADDACDAPRVHSANGDSPNRRNKFNLTIDTNAADANRNGYFYDPIYDFLTSSPVMKKLKELGFQYPTFPAKTCNKESKRLRILYAIIAFLLLTVLALVIFNIFASKIYSFRSTDAIGSNSSTINSLSSVPISPQSASHENVITDKIGTSVIEKPIYPTDKTFEDNQSIPITSPISNIKTESTVSTPVLITNITDQLTKGHESVTVFPVPGHAHFESGNFARDGFSSPVRSSTAKSSLSVTNITSTAVTVTSLFPASFAPDFKCPEDQFKCRAGISRLPCLYQWERCDGIADCSDGSDEELCDAIKCFGNFQCADKTCVSLAKVCNGIFDCPDGSDELRCDKFKCQSYEFRCPSGYCIPKEWVCDGEADCPGHFDEYNCSNTCSSNHFRCPEGWCISSSWQCNGIRDCAGGEDEQNCACPKKDQLKCTSGGSRCVDMEKICDGVSDCPDSSDEWNCVTLQNNALLMRDQGNDAMLPICSQEWSQQDSDLACRQLGYEKSDQSWEIAIPNENTTELFVKGIIVNAMDRVQFLVKKKPQNACATRKIIGLSCQKFDCGHWTGDHVGIHENRVRRMVGGIASKEHEWPSVAVLYHPQKKWACTASVIAPYWLITSALCVRRTDASPIDWKVIAGNADPSESDPDRQVARSILRFVQHPSYKLMLTLLADYDVMLVQLSSPLPFFNSNAFLQSPISPSLHQVSPICLPERPTPAGARCITAGWGYTSPGGYFINKQLKHLLVGIWPKEVCNSTAHYPGLLSERSICVSNDRDDWGPCFNDEGAPLMCQYPGVPDRWYLAGVLTSQSCGSAVKHPSVYADVYAMRNWINGVIGRPVIN